MNPRLMAAVPRSPAPRPPSPKKPLGRDAEEHRAGGVREAADDDIDGVLDRRAQRRRQRQVQQLVGRLVERETDPLVQRVREQHGPDSGKEQDEQAAEPKRERQDENRDRHAEAPQRRTGKQQLEHEADRAQGEVEGPEEYGQRIRVPPVAPIGHEAQLKRRPLRRDGDQEDERRHQAQVRTGADLPHAVEKRMPRRRAAARRGRGAESARSPR